MDNYYNWCLKLKENWKSKDVEQIIKLYKKNLELLDLSKKDYIIRIPIVEDYTYTDKNIKEIIEMLGKIKPQKVEIFKIHSLAKKKYETLQKKMNIFREISNEQMEKIKEKIEKLEIKCDIIKI